MFDDVVVAKWCPVSWGECFHPFIFDTFWRDKGKTEVKKRFVIEPVSQDLSLGMTRTLLYLEKFRELYLAVGERFHWVLSLSLFMSRLRYTVAVSID